MYEDIDELEETLDEGTFEAVGELDTGVLLECRCGNSQFAEPLSMNSECRACGRVLHID